MGARAYLLVNVNEDITQADLINTLKELEEMPGIDFVDPVVGSRDLVIMVDTPVTIEAIASQIRAKKGIKDLEILRIVSISERHRTTKHEPLKSTKPRCA